MQGSAAKNSTSEILDSGGRAASGILCKNGTVLKDETLQLAIFVLEPEVQIKICIFTLSFFLTREERV